MLPHSHTLLHAGIERRPAHFVSFLTYLSVTIITTGALIISTYYADLLLIYSLIILVIFLMLFIRYRTVAAERKYATLQLERLMHHPMQLEDNMSGMLTGIFERVTDGLIAFDREGIITYINKPAADMNRCRLDDMMGASLCESFPLTGESVFRKNFFRAIQTQQQVAFEMFATGCDCWFECFMYPGIDGLSLIFRDVTTRQQARQSIDESNEAMRSLVSHLQVLREEDRYIMAREIHDELGQQLTGIKLALRWLAKKTATEEPELLLQKINDAIKMLDETIHAVRRIASDLRPSILDNLGLVPAIEWQSQDFEKRSGIPTNFYTEIDEVLLDKQISTGIFRICQEALTNIARHAEASYVHIMLLPLRDGIVLQVMDDGNGFDKTKVSESHTTLGLLGMKERAINMGGLLDITTAIGSGSILSLRIPTGSSVK